MLRLAAAAALAVCLALAAPARAQQRIVHYAAPEPIPTSAMPLSVAITGWAQPAFTQAYRRQGTAEGDDQPTVTRYEARFAHGAYFGNLLLVESARDVQWRPPTPEAAIRDWPYFQGKPMALGASGSVVNGQMTIGYVLFQIADAEPKSCTSFAGAFERIQLRGYLCAVQSEPITEAAPLFIRAIGHPGVLGPVPAALPVLRATTAPGGQEIVAGERFDPRTMPFVPDATRSKLQSIYVPAAEAKALAVHESGAVAWMVGQSSEKEAIRRALERCAFQAHSPCMLYAVGNNVVFHHDALISQPVVNAAPPARPSAPSSAPGGRATPLSNAQLVAYLETATVLVVATQPRGASVGSGFFVSPDRLLTNRHVVDRAERVLVTSRTLGKPYPARIVAMTDRGAIGGADYALLEVPGLSHAPLTFTTELAKLQEVIAAGYPGVTIGNDADFRAFSQGKANAAPDLVITRGEVNALQVTQAKAPTVAHTAQISEGSSGGPLVDRCGRVVGINSYIAQKITVTGFAIASRDLIEFLNRNGVRTAVNNTVCNADAAVRR